MQTSTPKQVYACQSVSPNELRQNINENKTAILPTAVRLTYTDRDSFQSLARQFTLMDDFHVRLCH
jgi:hypothetical protein